MDKKYIALIIVILAIVGVVIFSGDGGYTSANISDVVMSEDFNEENFEPVGITDTYSSNTLAFHLSGQMNNVPSNTTVGVHWHYLNAENEDNVWLIGGNGTYIENNYITIDESSQVYFPLERLPSHPPFPEGTYEARIYIKGKGNVENVQFSVHENIE